MQFKQLVTDEDAVSPVIGVILMVAITVILAAVIASFVLGLGGTEDPAPTPVVEWSEEGNNAVVDITGGDSFDVGDMEVGGEGLNLTSITQLNEPSAADEISINGDDQDTSPLDDTDTLQAGDTIEIGLDPTEDDWEVEFYWNPADSDRELVTSQSS